MNFNYNKNHCLIFFYKSYLNIVLKNSLKLLQTSTNSRVVRFIFVFSTYIVLHDSFIYKKMESFAYLVVVYDTLENK
jgi:hypothetical protein